MEKTITLPKEIDVALDRVLEGARVFRASSAAIRNQVLEILFKKLSDSQGEILEANRRDLDAFPKDGSPSFRDRLILNPERLESMRESLGQVILLPAPVGEVVEDRKLKNGLRIRRVRSPLGVILMIFESRPNVAIEAFSLGLKSGNALVLKGGKESRETSVILYRLISEALAESGFSSDAFLGITNPDRSLVRALLSEKNRIDVVVPRGGEGLISFVVEHARMPIIKNDRGLCHVYVHADADLKMAATIIENAKVQRPGVCNSLETLLIHSSVMENLVLELVKRPKMKTVEFRVDPDGFPFFSKILGEKVLFAKSVDYDTEHLDLILNVGVVSSLDAAIAHIERHGSRHSESIVTRDESAARKFQAEVDAAAVYWNASTRFTDGFELGLGGELGISTQKLHVRGPVGLRELTSIRWVIDGEGQVR